MKIKELADKINKLCAEGKGNSNIVCRTGDMEDEGWDKIFDCIEFNFEDDIFIIDFDYTCFVDVKR